VAPYRHYDAEVGKAQPLQLSSMQPEADTSAYPEMLWWLRGNDLIWRELGHRLDQLEK
jgi:hypothetical protein